MRKITTLLFPAVILVFFTGCLKDKMTTTFTLFTPVYKEKAAVYAEIGSRPAQPVGTPGKLVISGSYIFLNEINKGVHVIDNSNPASPVLKAFIYIPGNIDIAVRGHYLYADIFQDMAVVDIADPLHAVFVKPVKNIFPERIYQNGFVSDTGRYIVGWTRRDTTVSIHYTPCPDCEYIAMDAAQVFSSGGSNGSPANSTAGSMARFSLVGDYLYTVNQSTLAAFNVGNPASPEKTSTQVMGWNIETIYPFSNKLFIGSSSGMFIYDISNPASPVEEGRFSHARACDPVIADGLYAYVTLRDGTVCDGTSNQLDLISISQLSNPSLLKSYPMINPHGLAKENNLLFVCDGKDGLKMYDAANPMQLSLKQHITGINTYDAIARNGNLMVVAADGLYQYSYTAAGNLQFISRISTGTK